ncbi:MAG TPA: glycine cleavage system protein H [Anaeromyxobacter sp.]|nr:glycine cleavage system protein H [Anaeromyxobacter sp.]
MTYDLLSVYPAKALEYLLGAGYLVLFVFFWRYVQGGAKARARAAARTPVPTGWFGLPAGVHLHPGHTWARVEPDGLVTVGMDDFATKLVGPLPVELPPVGASVLQGEAAFAVTDGARRASLAAPVDGTVVAVNTAPPAPDDPYGAGWLFRVKPPRLAANLRQLLTGSAAHRLLEDVSEGLARRMNPELGLVLQDGGAPITGIARTIAGDDWDALAREYFLS